MSVFPTEDGTALPLDNWHVWAAPVLPVLLASALESSLGFGAAIVLLLFAQIFIFSAQFGWLPALHPLLSSWEHWKFVTIVCQTFLLGPCLIASRPRQRACRQTLVGILPPMMTATLLGNSLQIAGGSGAKFRLLIGLSLGAYSIYQLWQILHDRHTRTNSSAVAFVKLDDSNAGQQASSPASTLSCVLVCTDSNGMIFQSQSVGPSDPLQDASTTLGAISPVETVDSDMPEPSRSNIALENLPGQCCPARQQHSSGAIKFNTVTVEPNQHGEIYLLKPDIHEHCTAIYAAGKAQVLANEDKPRKSFSEQMGECCIQCRTDIESSSNPRHVDDPSDDCHAAGSALNCLGPMDAADDESVSLLSGNAQPAPDAAIASNCAVQEWCTDDIPMVPTHHDYKNDEPSELDSVSAQKRSRRTLCNWVQTVGAGIASGLLGGLVGMWGPPVIMLLANSKLSASEIRSTAFCIGATGCAIRLVMTISGSTHPWETTWPLYVPVAISTVVGTVVGFSLHTHLCRRRALFRGLMLGVMLLCAICLLISGCIALVM